MLRFITAVGLLLLAVSNAWGLGTEQVGNEPFSDANYTDWPNVMPVINDTHRVFQQWVNGNEHFYFAGDTAALNAALKNFAAVKGERLVVVLRPAPGKATSFQKKHTVTYNWNLHLLGGISKHMSTLELGNNVWDPNPHLNVYVGGPIKLEAIKIPSGVEVLEIADLQTRYAKSLASGDQTVRGWACGELARLDPHDAKSMRKIAAKLDDKVDWVKLNAAGALTLFASEAEEVVEKLQAVKTDDEQLQKRIATSIDTLRNAKPKEATRKEFQQLLGSIHEFVVSQRQGR